MPQPLLIKPQPRRPHGWQPVGWNQLLSQSHHVIPAFKTTQQPTGSITVHNANGQPVNPNNDFKPDTRENTHTPIVPVAPEDGKGNLI